MKTPTLGALLYAFFEDHLKAQKGLSPATIRSYRDAVRLFLTFVATDRRCKLTRVRVCDLTAERVRRFLSALETERHNHIRSRNRRLGSALDDRPARKARVMRGRIEPGLARPPAPQDGASQCARRGQHSASLDRASRCDP